MRNSLLKKFFSFSYGSWLSLPIALGTSMVTTRLLSPDSLGRASMYTLFISVLMLACIFGIDQAFVRFFYEESEENRPNLLFQCLKLPLLIGVLVSAITLVFWKPITQYLFQEESYSLAIYLIVGIVFAIISRFSTLVIRMQQKGALYSNIQILNKVFAFLLIIAFYFIIGKSYKVIILSSLVTSILLTLFSIFKEKEFWKFDKKNQNKLKYNFKDILKYSYPLFFVGIISWLFQSFDKVALKEWSNYTELGLYTAAFRIVALISILQTTFTVFWTPVCYERYQTKPDDLNFFATITSVISFVMFVVAVGCIGGKDIIVLLLGKEYRTAANIMPFLVFMPVMYTISETTVIGINFKKKTKWHILIAGISCTVNIVGNSLLVPKYGATGAALATAISYIVFFYTRTKISLKYYKINYKLKRIYFTTVLIFCYALFSTINTNFYYNIGVGLVLIGIIVIIYKKDIVFIYSNYVKGNV